MLHHPLGRFIGLAITLSRFGGRNVAGCSVVRYGNISTSAGVVANTMPCCQLFGNGVCDGDLFTKSCQPKRKAQTGLAAAVQMTALLYAFGFLDSDVGELLALQFVFSFTGAIATPMVYLNLLENRLAPKFPPQVSACVCLAGFGLGLLWVPAFVHCLLEDYGWRTAAVSMALLFGSINVCVWCVLLQDG
jgi:hypothetical protein